MNLQLGAGRDFEGLKSLKRLKIDWDRRGCSRRRGHVRITHDHRRLRWNLLHLLHLLHLLQMLDLLLYWLNLLIKNDAIELILRILLNDSAALQNGVRRHPRLQDISLVQ